jgi:hypothetical protein
VRTIRRFLVAAVVVLALVSSATAVLAAAKTSKAVVTHKLIVTVKKNLAPAAESKFALLILISNNGGAPAGAVATARKSLIALLDNSGLCRVKAEIDSACKGSCDVSYRVSGSTNQRPEIIPSCQPKDSASSAARSTSSGSTEQPASDCPRSRSDPRGLLVDAGRLVGRHARACPRRHLWVRLPYQFVDGRPSLAAAAAVLGPYP